MLCHGVVFFKFLLLGFCWALLSFVELWRVYSFPHHAFLYLLERVSIFIITLMFVPAYSISIISGSVFISCFFYRLWVLFSYFFVGLLPFNWMLNIVNFILLGCLFLLYSFKCYWVLFLHAMLLIAMSSTLSSFPFKIFQDKHCKSLLHNNGAFIKTGSKLKLLGHYKWNEKLHLDFTSFLIYVLYVFQ